MEVKWLILTLNTIRSHRRNLRTQQLFIYVWSADIKKEEIKNQPIETCKDVKTCLYALLISTIKVATITITITIRQWRWIIRRMKWLSLSGLYPIYLCWWHSIAYDIDDKQHIVYT